MEEEDIVKWDFAKKTARDEAIHAQMANRKSGGGGAADPAAIGHHGHARQFQRRGAGDPQGRRPGRRRPEGRRSVEIILADLQVGRDRPGGQAAVGRRPNAEGEKDWKSSLMSVLRTFLGRKPCPWALLALFAAIAFWPIQQAAVQTEKAKNGVVRIVLGGDVMLDGGPGHALSYGEDPFADLAPILTSADVAVCNLECVVAQHGKHVLQRYTFKARPECIPVLKRHFSAVCLANNHSGDYGPEGFLEELSLLEKGRLSYFGGGRDRKEAHRPLILERNGRRIALLGYNDFPPALRKPAMGGPASPGSPRPTPLRTSRRRGASFTPTSSCSCCTGGTRWTRAPAMRRKSSPAV